MERNYKVRIQFYKKLVGFVDVQVVWWKWNQIHLAEEEVMWLTAKYWQCITHVEQILKTLLFMVEGQCVNEKLGRAVEEGF